MRVSGRPFRSAMARYAGLSLFLWGLASPSLAQEEATGLFRFFRATPPWAAEAPGVARARFGLGSDLFFEHQESLHIADLAKDVRLLDLRSGREESQFLREDPGLLNRKLDILLELRGGGSELSLPLPGLARFGLYPSLVFQAAAAKVHLDFLDRTRTEDSTAYEGWGSLLGTGLDVTTSLCPGCQGYTAIGYRFQKLPSFSVDQSPPFGPPGFEVLGNQTRLGREVHELSFRTGYSSPGNRIASYIGVRHRWTELEAEGELRYRDPLAATETSISSRTRLESEATLALAGVEAHLAGRFYARIETAVGNGDRVALVKVVYLGPPPPDGKIRQAIVNIALQLGAIKAAFLAGWKRLKIVEGPDGLPAYLSQDVEFLLMKTEQDIFAALGLPELEPLRDWVSDEFRAVRVDLGLEASGVSVSRMANSPLAALAVVVDRPFPPEIIRLVQSPRRTVGQRRADNNRDRVSDRTIGIPEQRLRTGQHMTQLIFETPLGRGAMLLIYPRFNRKSPCAKLLSRNRKFDVCLGSYSFEVKQTGRAGALPSCSASRNPPEGTAPCPLDLVVNPYPILECDDIECTPEDYP